LQRSGNQNQGNADPLKTDAILIVSKTPVLHKLWLAFAGSFGFYIGQLVSMFVRITCNGNNGHGLCRFGTSWHDGGAFRFGPSCQAVSVRVMRMNKSGLLRIKK